MSNIELWEQVCITDPAAVKKITGKPYQGDSPKPYWLIRRATEVFGPCGVGWGVTVKSERFERLSETDVLHVAVVAVWFVHDGKRSESIEQMGGTKAAYMTKNGQLVVDEDAGKKSVTDGMVKCLSMIGFAGDIFAGMWNDSKYVEWAAEQFKPANPLDTFASELVQLHEEKADMEAVRLWYASKDIQASNEAREYVWSQLRDYPALRSAIKANKPVPKAEIEQLKKEAGFARA